MRRLRRLNGGEIPAYAGMTGRFAPPSAVPSPAAFAASSPLLGRGGDGASAPSRALGRLPRRGIRRTSRISEDGTVC